MHKARSLVQDAYGNAIEETSQQLNITAQVVGPPGVQPTYTILQHQNTAGGLCFQIIMHAQMNAHTVHSGVHVMQLNALASSVASSI